MSFPLATLVPHDAPGNPPRATGLFRLRILATTDLHVHITPWDYYADRSSATAGLARTATLIAAARAEAETCLLLDNGDFLQGSPMGDLEAQRNNAEQPHPMIAAMNALGYDAATLGNHEFSNGLAYLLRQLGQARFPVVSANISRQLGDTPIMDQTLLPHSVILLRSLSDGRGNRQLIRIGVLGLVPPQTTQWDHQQLGDTLVTRDIVEAAAAHVPKLREQGADIVIALSHSGIAAPSANANLENATAALAALPGIDALVAGHTHQTFPSADFAASTGVDPVRGLLWGKPAVMPGFHGSHLGVIDLSLARRDGAWHVAGSQVEVRPISRRAKSGRVVALTRSATDIMTIAAPAHRATRAWSRQPLGYTGQALHSYFALVMPSPTVRLVARAQARHVARLLQHGPYADLPLVSAAAPFHVGGRGGPENYTAIPAGPLMMRHAFDLYPHPNTIAALLVSGAELALWLERSFSLFHQVSPGTRDADLIDPEFPGFNFDLLEGLTWTVDLAAPPHHDTNGRVINPSSRRIRNLAHQGRPVDPAARFVLATNSYRASGSGGFAGASHDNVILSGPDSSRDVVLAYLAATTSTSDATTDPGPPNWDFAPMVGTTAVFDSAPAAAACTAELAQLDAEPLGLTATGFRRFRLRL